MSAIETPAAPAARRDRALVSVAIPTFGRDQVLLDTIEQFRSQNVPPAEIIVVDQTPVHEPYAEHALTLLARDGAIFWHRLAVPSQPAALNFALRVAKHEIVLMVDDDIAIDRDFVESHSRDYSDEQVWAVAGQVLQPGETPLAYENRPDSDTPWDDIDFPFRGSQRRWVRNGMSGNLSVRRQAALSAGGFDENFSPPVSYRFDAEFCARLWRAGGRIVFDPRASIRHLRHPRGGTRSLGNHMRSASPAHGVGDYYFALRQGLSVATAAHIARRPIREVCTRFHARHPWWIPIKLFGELRAILAAVALTSRGPRILSVNDPTDD